MPTVAQLVNDRARICLSPGSRPCYHLELPTTLIGPLPFRSMLKTRGCCMAFGW